MSSAAPRVTAADVARVAGTSAAVVSYVVNDGPRPVAATTRARVVAAIDRLGYRPNPLGRALRTRTTETIGVLVPTLKAQFFAELVDALQTTAREHGRHTLVGITNFSAADETSLALALADHRTDALIVVGAAARSGLPPFERPVVHLHHRPAGHSGPLVRADDRAAGRLAARYLLIGDPCPLVCVAPPALTGPVKHRMDAIRRAVREAGRERDLVVVPAPCDRAQTRDRVLERLPDLPRRLAIVALTDEHAMGTLAAARLAGRDIPDEVRLVTIDGTAETEAPALTAVVLPIAAMARHAVELALDPDRTPPPPLAVELIVRRTT
jgi:LacI family transcriptional regulator